MNISTDIETVTITSKNMIVIPKRARQKLHLQEGQKLNVFIVNNEVILSPLLPLEKLAGILSGPASASQLLAESRKHVSRYDK